MSQKKGLLGFPGPDKQTDSVPGPLGVRGGQLKRVCPKWPPSEEEMATITGHDNSARHGGWLSTACMMF